MLYPVQQCATIFSLCVYTHMHIGHPFNYIYDKGSVTLLYNEIKHCTYHI